MECPYKWDGSGLGVLYDSNIISDLYDIYTKMKYWTICVDGYIETCSYRAAENASICIYDEAMKIFNLPKMGSHHMIYKNKLYILLKATLTKDRLFIQSHTLLSTLEQKKMPPDLMEKIRIVYTVRDILGVYHTTDSDIIIIFTSTPCYPDLVVSMKSYITNTKILKNHTSTITKTALEKWYKDTNTKKLIDTRDIYKNIFPGVTKIDDISIYSNDFKSELDEIIERVDKQFCYISDLIATRLINRLTRMLNHM